MRSALELGAVGENEYLPALRLRSLGAALATALAQGDVIVVRYADDMVVGFQYLADAHRFLAELKQRLEAFALEVHPDKTRIIERTVRL